MGTTGMEPCRLYDALHTAVAATDHQGNGEKDGRQQPLSHLFAREMMTLHRKEAPVAPTVRLKHFFLDDWSSSTAMHMKAQNLVANHTSSDTDGTVRSAKMG